MGSDCIGLSGHSRRIWPWRRSWSSGLGSGRSRITQEARNFCLMCLDLRLSFGNTGSVMRSSFPEIIQDELAQLQIFYELIELGLLGVSHGHRSDWPEAVSG